MQTLSKNEFALFQELLIEESGLYLDKDRSDFLQIALSERLHKKNYSSYQEYYNLLRFHPEGRKEIHELLDRLTVGETYFFRNLPQFDALKRFILPEIVGRKTSSPPAQGLGRVGGGRPSLRIWSAGCSRGDEPYSVAIAIMEALPNHEEWDIHILGTDINRSFIVTAKEAVYRKKNVRPLTEDQVNRFFHKIDTQKYALDNKVKRMVKFEHHNLAKDPFTLEGMRNLDIILCRNVTIYFDIQTTRKIIDNFYNCLSWNGYLFIGHAETMWRISDRFETVEFPQTFVYKKVHYPVKTKVKPFMSVPEIKLERFELPSWRREEKKPLSPSLPIQNRESKNDSAKIKKEVSYLYKEANRLYNEKKYDEAMSLFNEIIGQHKDFTGAYLAKATIMANQARYKEAIDELNEIITVDNLYVEAYYLLGVLFYKIKDFDEAEIQFKKVIYVNPDIALAYFNLGNIYLSKGKSDKAAREFRNAAILLEKRAKEETVMFSEDFTVDFLLRACKNKIAEIKSE